MSLVEKVGENFFAIFGVYEVWLSLGWQVSGFGKKYDGAGIFSEHCWWRVDDSELRIQVQFQYNDNSESASFGVKLKIV